MYMVYGMYMVVSYKCKSKRCQVCNNITEADSITCSNDQTNFKINHRFDCNERCLIYLITCNGCLKQYVGQTVDEFRYRWNNYKDNARKFERGEQCMQRHLYEHFNLPDHSGFFNDVSVTLIDKTDPTDPTKREDYWIHTLKTKHHWDLMLKVVFRRNSLYFASLIVFMDGLYLGNDFRTRFLRFLLFLLLFLLFFCWWGCFVGPVIVVSGFVSLFYYYYYYYIFILRFFLIPCGYVRYYLV